MKTLHKDEIERAGMRIRTVDGKPAVERAPEPEPEKPDPMLGVLERLGASFDSMRTAFMELKPKDNDVAISAVLKMLKQNAELLQTVKDMIEIDAHQERMEDESEPQEWEFEIRDADGKLTKTIKAKECK